jgi:hypothetical protein
MFPERIFPEKYTIIKEKFMEKVRQLEFFMTIEDEDLFCKTLRDDIPNVYFLDVAASKEGCINKRLFLSVTESESSIFSIVNFDMIDKDTLSRSYKKYDEYYHFLQTGRAQIQFLRSKPDTRELQNLQNGRLSDSYYTENEEEKKWKSIVYRILKKMGNKVYWCYSTPEGCFEIKTKAENGLVALPNALKKYNGKTGFMTHGKAKFVGEGISIQDLCLP